MSVTSDRTPGEWRQLSALAGPLALQQIGLLLMGAVDTALLGRYSAGALAGSGVGNSMFFAISCVGMGILMGLDALVPNALGGGRHDEARSYLHAGVRLAILLSVPATLLTMWSPWLLRLAHVPADVEYEAKIFILARCFGVLPFMLQVAMRGYLSAHGRTKALVIAVVGGNILNAIADYVFIFGDDGLSRIGLPRLGIPAMGVVGAALATSAVQFINLGIYLFAVRRLHRSFVKRTTPRRQPLTALVPILRVGVPIGLQMLAEVGVFALAGILAAHLGEIPGAAHNIALTLASFTFSAAVGIGAATSVRVGHALGRGDRHAARRAGFTGLSIGMVVMSIAALVFIIFARPLAQLFTNDANVVEASVPLLRIAALFQLSDGAQAIASGALRGAQDTTATLWANLIGHYGVGLGLSLICGFAFHGGAVGIWWGLSAGLTVTAALLVRRFAQMSRD